uniref:Uncharacterized protein n=1 Tax=Magallana gigas TaxID=29159 RepID=A0A8W8KU91_MAGGI
MPTRISPFFFSNPRNKLLPFLCPQRSLEERLQSAREQTYYAKFFKRWKQEMKDSATDQEDPKCHPLYRKIPHQPTKKLLLPPPPGWRRNASARAYLTVYHCELLPVKHPNLCGHILERMTLTVTRMTVVTMTRIVTH